MSGYRPAFAPGDPRTAQNPVNHMHVRLTVGGKSYHVLSRVANYGIDYTQRYEDEFQRLHNRLSEGRAVRDLG